MFIVKSKTKLEKFMSKVYNIILIIEIPRWVVSTVYLFIKYNKNNWLSGI